MNIQIIDFTRNAVDKLLYTKMTRLTQGEDRWKVIYQMTEEEKMEELRKMAETIPSSWEFVTYTFDITGVTRAFTHQFVRTRTGSYAQQTMRVLAMEDWTYGTGPTIEKKEGEQAWGPFSDGPYKQAMNLIKESYEQLLGAGVAIEDARGILPTNIHTNIIAQFSLRALAEMSRSRGGQRTQGEYRDVLQAMFSAVITIHPWADMFLNPPVLDPVKKLEAILLAAKNNMAPDLLTSAFKQLDLLRKSL